MRQPDVGKSADADDRGEAPARSSGLTLAGLLGGALLTAVLLGQLTAPDPPPRPTATASPTTAADLQATPEPEHPIGVVSPPNRCPLPMGALALGDSLHNRGSALEVWDCDAWTQGPWSLVIRASEGHFGARSAVVTFPWSASQRFRSTQDFYPHRDLGEPSTPVTQPRGGRWSADTQSLVWPLGGSRAQIVGDLGQAHLAELAMRITVERGRPVLLSTPEGFAARDATPLRIPVIHKIRYQTTDLGEGDTLGIGQVWTGVAQPGAALESQLFMDGARPAGLVRGKPAVYTHNVLSEWMSLGPDSANLVWESGPGEVTYIGFSGTANEAKAVETLRVLADLGTWLAPNEWETQDRAQVYP